tara:strand:- start:4857 stop:5582 length:726 start_codon:yes stop_codon:yes gene_type:complete
MKNITIITILMLPLSCFSQALSSQDFLNEVKKEIGHRLNAQKPTTINESTGMEESKTFKQDLSFVKFNFSLNSDPMSIGDVISASFEYNSHWYENKFINYSAYTGQHRFDAISSVNADLSANANNVNSQTNNLSALGVGITMTSHFFKNVLNINAIEESISSSFAYGFMNESTQNEIYSGPGVRAEVSINYRPKENYHFGAAFGWNHFGLSRDMRFEGEDISGRHLSATWATLGLNWAVYF